MSNPHADVDNPTANAPMRSSANAASMPAAVAAHDGPALLALDIARCRELQAAAQDTGHPCHKIVDVQSHLGDQRHLPEGWAGNLTEGKVLFISSNPSISELGDYVSADSVEAFPTPAWTDAQIVDFTLHRFGAPPHAPATPDGHFRCLDGQYRGPVHFWRAIRGRARELLGAHATPEQDYCMTEVVHCKSKKEIGVKPAVSPCTDRYLDRVLALSPASVVVLVGKHAFLHLAGRLDLPPAPGPVVARRHLGGRERVVTFLWGPASGKPKTFPTLYSADDLATLRAACT